MSDRVVIIGGRDFNNKVLPTVSSSNLTNDKWVSTLAQLNEARYAASACFFASTHVYVFAGSDDRNCLNSIERIHSVSLGLNGNDFWELIQMP